MEAIDQVDKDADGSEDLDENGTAGEKLELVESEEYTLCNIVTTTSEQVVCETEPLRNYDDAANYNKQDRLLKIIVKY
jgi:hypothetical protein